MRGPNYWSVQQHRLVVCKVEVAGSGRTSQQENDAVAGLPEKIASLSSGDIMAQERAIRTGDRREYYARLCALLASVLQPNAKAEEMQKFDVLPAVETATFRLLVPYEEEACGLYAVKAAVKIVAGLLNGTDYDPAPDMIVLEQIYRRQALGPSTAPLLMRQWNEGYRGAGSTMIPVYCSGMDATNG